MTSAPMRGGVEVKPSGTACVQEEKSLIALDPSPRRRRGRALSSKNLPVWRLFCSTAR